MKLALREVAVGHDGKTPIQKYVNMSVESGQVCCILGPNGCGKTTLVKTIIGLIPLISGRITIDGEDITKWSAPRLSQTVAYVSQSHEQPFPFLVKDVVMMGRINRAGRGSSQPNREDYNVVENAMMDMGVYHLRDVPYCDVSGGELQMVMFARAIAQEPQMLILDEPTSALDYGNAIKVVQKVRELSAAGYAVLMITHNPDHAFMMGAQVALFTHDDPMKFGNAFSIITRENIQAAYGVSVKLVEFTHSNQQVMRMCAPEFGWSEDANDANNASAGGAGADTSESATTNKTSNTQN